MVVSGWCSIHLLESQGFKSKSKPGPLTSKPSGSKPPIRVKLILLSGVQPLVEPQKQFLAAAARRCLFSQDAIKGPYISCCFVVHLSTLPFGPIECESILGCTKFPGAHIYMYIYVEPRRNVQRKIQGALKEAAAFESKAQLTFFKNGPTQKMSELYT